MAESDDEYAGDKKKSRDKFERERSDYDERSRVWTDQVDASNAGWIASNRGVGGQRAYNNRNNNNRYQGPGHGQRRPSDTRDRSPSYKRMKGDSDDRVTVHSTYMTGLSNNRPHDNRQRHDGYRHHDIGYRSQFDVDQTVPMSFKEFLMQLDGDVDESEALKKYEDYKSDLSQTKVEKFFDVHKDEEWFRIKYHPEDRQKRITLQMENMQTRLRIFKELLNSKYLDKINLDISRTDDLIQLMDTIVVKLEGETQESVEDILEDLSNSDKADTNGHSAVKRDESEFHQKSDGESSKRAVKKKNLSIVLENLPTDVTKAEVLDLCKDREGLIRVSLTDPYFIEGGQLRRKAFATFRGDVDIKDICIACKLRKVKIRNCEVEASINRELTKRVRPINGIASHKSVVMNDLKNAATIILNFDDQRKVWDIDSERTKNKNISNDGGSNDNKDYSGSSQEQPEESKDTKSSEVQSSKNQGQSKSADRPEGSGKWFRTSDPFFTDFKVTQTAEELETRLSKSKNPLLRDIGLYLVEEVSAEEYELLAYGCEVDQKKSVVGGEQDTERFERSEEHIGLLDKLLLYLRVVHSFDYYNYTEYKLEDDMPNRLGILHVRGAWPPTDPDSATAIADDPFVLSKDLINNYITDFNNKIKLYAHGRPDDEMTEEQRLIMRDFDVELNSDLESCVAIKTTNKTQKEVYECKHCKKKFEKKMEFLKKHVLTKHQEATAVILADVEFFNSYLFDPHRIDPVPPKELLKTSLNDSRISQNEYEMDPMAKAAEAYDKLDAFVREPAPRGPSTTDPRAATLVDYGDISFDDAI